MVAEKRCGDSPDAYIFVYSAEHLAGFSDCTVLVGRLQADAVRDVEDFAALRNVTRIEGVLNVFRSPGFLTLHGLENLEVVQGDVFIHLNPNLTSIAALGKLRTVTGNLMIVGNDRLPQDEVEAVAAPITVGGTKTLMQSSAP
jgi:Receptor L domain